MRICEVPWHVSAYLFSFIEIKPAPNSRFFNNSFLEIKSSLFLNVLLDQRDRIVVKALHAAYLFGPPSTTFGLTEPPGEIPEHRVKSRF